MVFSQTIIKDLNDRGFIASSSLVSAYVAIQGLEYNYTKSAEPEYEKVLRGTFV